MTRILAFLVVLLACVSCTRLGSISGRWRADDGETFQFIGNGSYVSAMEMADKGSTARSRVEGRYEMSGNQLTLHVAKTFSAMGKGPLVEKDFGDMMPREWRYTIRALDERELVLVDEFGQAHAFKRQP